MSIVVITGIPDPAVDSGNLASAMVLPDPDQEIHPEFGNVVMAALTMGRTEVFQLGEILILDHNDRDYGTTRKPSKWHIDYEECATLDEAMALSAKVVAERDNAED